MTDAKWKVLHERGNIFVALVTKDGTVVERLPQRFGTAGAAKSAAQAMNDKAKRKADGTHLNDGA